MPSSDRKAPKKKGKPKPTVKSHRPSRPRKLSIKNGSRPRRKTVAKKDDATYVYECTRLGCGYKIWRDDRGETGQLRTDLKCPKCHHLEFRCLGRGDLPESFQVPLPTNLVDFDAVKTSEIGSN